MGKRRQIRLIRRYMDSIWKIGMAKWKCLQSRKLISVGQSRQWSHFTTMGWNPATLDRDVSILFIMIVKGNRHTLKTLQGTHFPGHFLYIINSLVITDRNHSVTLRINLKKRKTDLLVVNKTMDETFFVWPHRLGLKVSVCIADPLWQDDSLVSLSSNRSRNTGVQTGLQRKGNLGLRWGNGRMLFLATN